MDKVFIRDLRIQAIIGIREWERQTPQEVLINVVLQTDTRPAAISDDILDCVDYSELAKEIRALVEAARRFTVEALAEDIARVCLERKGVPRVTVRVEKPGAVTGAASVGVEIERP
jgi:FolB domain-containing protein